MLILLETCHEIQEKMACFLRIPMMSEGSLGGWEGLWRDGYKIGTILDCFIFVLFYVYGYLVCM